jgi:clan AA aspartic protease
VIVGEVTPENEAVIPLAIEAVSGTYVTLDAVVDTGFSDYLTLPPDLIGALGLPFREVAEFSLADGTAIQLSLFRARVQWGGGFRDVLVAESDGGALVGMALLKGHRLTLEALDGGKVTIEPLGQP